MTALEPANFGQRLPLTTDAFFLLDQQGLFRDYRKTELIEGDIIVMNSQFRPHAYLKQTIAYALHDALRETGLAVIAEVTVAMPPHSAPEPDIVVTSEPKGEGAIPLDSVRLIVEVSDATLRTDLKQKAALYARHGVPEYWVADINAHLLHIHAEPGPQGYARKLQQSLDEPIAALTLPGVSIRIDD